MPRKLLDTVQEMEAQEAKKAEEKKEKSEVKKPIEKIISKEGAKDKQISAKINMQVFNAFTRINRIKGLSNNSAINMLINKYVRENKSLLSEDDYI